MKDFILVWENTDYPEMGGGTNFEQFENLLELENRVNALQKSGGENFSIVYAAEIKEVIEFKPVEKVIRWEASR